VLTLAVAAVAASPLSAGQDAELADNAAKTYVAALCPAGTLSSRSGATKTIKTARL
jgi:hypothetical protein